MSHETTESICIKGSPILFLFYSIGDDLRQVEIQKISPDLFYNISEKIGKLVFNITDVIQMAYQVFILSFISVWNNFWKSFKKFMIVLIIFAANELITNIFSDKRQSSKYKASEPAWIELDLNLCFCYTL